MQKFSKTLVISAVAIAALFSGCGSDSNDDDTSSAGGRVGSDFDTVCGAVVNGSRQDPLSSSKGTQISGYTVAGSNLVVIETATGPQLVKLHGIGTSEARNDATARAVLNKLLATGAYFFQATPDCVYSSIGGGLGTAGQLITPNGLSLSEELIRARVAGPIETTGSCAEEEIAPCFQALHAEVQASIPPNAGTVNWFLWKPKSDGGYNHGLLSILVDSCNVRVFVNGTELIDFGPSNGRCTTMRSTTTSGCGFGSNARVEVIDKNTGAPYLFPDGNPYYIIPNGCNRVEYRN